MAKSKVFAVYDSKVGAYLNPFFMQSAAQAIRAFGDTAKDEKSMFNKHPGDFTLFQIGEYDDETGKIDPSEAKINLGTALEIVGDPGLKRVEVPARIREALEKVKPSAEACN